MVAKYTSLARKNYEKFKGIQTGKEMKLELMQVPTASRARQCSALGQGHRRSLLTRAMASSGRLVQTDCVYSLEPVALTTLEAMCLSIPSSCPSGASLGPWPVAFSVSANFASLKCSPHNSHCHLS